MQKYKFYHSVYLDRDACKGCINCIKRCPTKAIRVRNGKAVIINEFCTDCGECIRHCPHNAKKARRDGLEILDEFKYTVALPAPTLYSQYNNIKDTNLLLTGLLRLGFDDVFEVSGAAELVTEATGEYIDAHPEKWPLISTACPTVIRLIRVRFPELIDHMLPILPPVEIAANLARQRAVKKTGLDPEDIGIIFISPCPSKLSFIKEPLGLKKSNVDAAVAIKDVYPILLKKLKGIHETEIQDLAISGDIGVGWSVIGGEIRALNTHQYIAADGIENVIDVLESLEDEKIGNNLQYIELNACNCGCVGGVLNVENPYIARAKNNEIKKNLPRVVSTRDEIRKDYNLEEDWTDEIVYEPVYQLGNNIKESMANYRTVQELLKELPELDCGGCGAPSCKSLAEDVIRGQATKDDCIYLLRDKYDELKNSQLFGEDE